MCKDRRIAAKFYPRVVGTITEQLRNGPPMPRDDEFRRERTLPNGWVLNTKEELMYYRIFRAQFGELSDLSWMGRTKGAPRH